VATVFHLLLFLGPLIPLAPTFPLLCGGLQRSLTRRSVGRTSAFSGMFPNTCFARLMGASFDLPPLLFLFPFASQRFWGTVVSLRIFDFPAAWPV